MKLTLRKMKGDYIMNAYEEFMQSIHKPMREDLVNVGFTELLTADDVQDKMDTIKGTALIVINSVCGCAAGQARPAVQEALKEAKQQPTHLLTVFAGQDKEATQKMREYFPEVEPSSPSIALWKDGELAHFIPREQIEISEMHTIKAQVTEMLNEHIV